MANMTEDIARLEIDNFLCSLKRESLDTARVGVGEYVKQLSRESLEYKFLLAVMHMENLIRSRL